MLLHIPNLVVQLGFLVSAMMASFIVSIPIVMIWERIGCIESCIVTGGGFGFGFGFGVWIWA
jgi:hypothetical protein